MAGTGLYKEILVLNDRAKMRTTNGLTSRDPPFSLTSAFLLSIPPLVPLPRGTNNIHIIYHLYPIITQFYPYLSVL